VNAHDPSEISSLSSASASPPCSDDCSCRPQESSISRRDFVFSSALASSGMMLSGLSAVAGPFRAADFENQVPLDKKLSAEWLNSLTRRGNPERWRGTALAKIGMPIGGLCCGQLYLGGDGKLWHWDIFNLPQPANFSDTGGPNYAKPPQPISPLEQGFAIKVTAGGKTETRHLSSRGFAADTTEFQGQYPIATVEYKDSAFPVAVNLTAFSPFIPLDVDDSSLPATLLRYTVKNTGTQAAEVELVGWLENAVCAGSGKAGMGRRRNRIVRHANHTLLFCTAEAVPAPKATPKRDDIVFEDFEQGYGKWTVEGAAFGAAPATGTLPNQQAVSGFAGKHLVNSFLGGDVPLGKMTSKPFVIERRCIQFLIGGGSHAGRTCLNLVVDGAVVRTATGQNNERLELAYWDVGELQGRQAHLEIVDNAADGWGHINLDHIVFSDEPPAAFRDITAQEDYGSLGLALLGDGKGDFGLPHVPSDPAEVIFSSAADKGERTATQPFGRPLVGAIGRKLTLQPGEQQDITFALTWHFSGLLRRTLGPLQDIETLRRAYHKRFKDAQAVSNYIAGNHQRLTEQTLLWNKTWYDSTLPYWFLDRTFIPLCTLATSTCYQFDNGRFYAFEGVYCCQGTCQHVWNYAQGLARIFPALERDLRQRTDFGLAWHENGATDYRGECARNVAHDGQCGVILRAYREHQMSADSAFLRRNWARIRKSIEYMIGCDADTDGLLEGEQYNTLDAAWYGPMAWISSLYLAALRAGEAMATEMNDSPFAARCTQIAERGTKELVARLYNGEYFIHLPDPKHPEATNTNNGCHIDQLMGQAWAMQVHLPRVAPREETLSALSALWKYNFTPDAGAFRNTSKVKGGRWYAMPGEGGMVMTTFPRGGGEKATGNGGFGYYFNEVWTGQEHQVAAHLIWEGKTQEGLALTRMIHDRHHPTRRNPYNEVECSDHYTRAMSSYGTFLAACGYEYHGPQAHLGFAPRLSPEDFRAAFTAAEGWGTFAQQRVGQKQKETLTVAWGKLRLKSLTFQLSNAQVARQVSVKAGDRTIAQTFKQQEDRVLISFREAVVLKANEALEVTIE
jgi:non-lysosomal glucosylceramidase